jgi:epoxyqueuosine reductase
MSLTKDIKDFALNIGYSKVGITSADDFSNFIQDFQSRGATYELFSQGPFVKGAKPRAIMPSARSVISVVWDYAQKAFPESLVGKIGRIYQARSYNAPPDHINGARYRLLVDFLKKAGCKVGEGIAIPERQAAARAGIVSFGKNNFSYAQSIGSFIFLSSIIVDKELEYDTPIQDLKCPKDCTRCIDACPTQAIYEPLKLDPKRCIAFNNFFAQDGPGRSSYIVPEIREKIGTRVYGCDACQEACPRNAARLKAKLPQDEFLVRWSEEFSLPKMLEMSDSYYEKTIRPIMYNYIKDKKYLQRNAAIALGNTRDPQHIPSLTLAMENPEDVVRGYAAWALGRIGGDQAKAVLESRLKQENSAFVITEIKAALPACEASRGSAG